jgi:hypothetical protein
MNDRELAQLADISYEKDVNKRRLRAEQLGYDYDPELSHEHASVFRHRNTDKGIVAYRGSRDLKDLTADIDVVLGRTPEARVQDALRIHAGAKRKYQNGVYLTGHSLGGTLAHHVSDRTGDEAVIFNPGSSPFKRATKSGKVRVYRNPFDIVSLGYIGQANNVTRSEHPIELLAPWTAGYFNHSATQFFS